MATFMADPQPLANFPHYDTHSSFGIDMQVPNWYATSSVPETWASSGNNSEKGNNSERSYNEFAPSPLHSAGTSICSKTFIDNQKSLAQRYHHHSLETDRLKPMNDLPNLSHDTSCASSMYGSGSLHSAPAMFPSNYGLLQPQHPRTITPIQTTSLEQIESADPSPTDSVFFYDGLPREPKKSRKDSTQTKYEPQHQHPPQHQVSRPSSSPSQSSTSSQPLPKRRRRRSEYAEPGSARAIYLQKNRQAASKCRNKQKRQQEVLVEEARDVERMNKVLKAEVAILQQGMRDLMELIAQHADCPDTRLKMYVQREADRLAAGEGRSPSVGIKDEGLGS